MSASTTVFMLKMRDYARQDCHEQYFLKTGQRADDDEITSYLMMRGKDSFDPQDFEVWRQEMERLNKITSYK
jgi:hypothetical protein